MNERLFAIACDGNYHHGLLALLNSLHAYHGKEIPVHLYLKGMDGQQLKALEEHPLRVQVFFMEVFPLPVPGIWEAKQQVFAHCLGLARCVYLLDADLVLTSRVDDVFALAAEGRIVSSSDGAHGVDYGQDYARYGPGLPGTRQAYINSGALCLDVIRHWDLVGLWAFASQYGAYSPGGGAPLGLPGHGDQGVLNAVAALLNKRPDFHVLPEGSWCDSTRGCTLRIVARDGSGCLEVWNETDGTRQRLVHSSGPKWWTDEGVAHLRRFGDKLDCFLHFATRTASPAGPARVEPFGRNGAQGVPRILIGICSCNAYANKRKGVRDTWLRTLPPGVTALFFTGEGGATDEPGLVRLPCPDDYGHLPSKVQGFYRYALAHHDFDYIFKCDDDTYVHAGRLLELPRSGASFIGDAHHMQMCGFVSGGAGYLLSREMAKRFVASPIEAQGAEDVVFSHLAKTSGLRLDISSRLHAGPDDPPGPDNSVITAHWCDPGWMRSIHQELFGEVPGSPILKLRAKHAAWSGFIRLYSDGSFIGGGANPHGTWKAAQEGDLLILQWHHWSAGKLRLQSWGFEEPNFRLEFLDEQGPERWREMLAFQPSEIPVVPESSVNGAEMLETKVFNLPQERVSFRGGRWR